jgi:hypothetical protein
MVADITSGVSASFSVNARPMGLNAPGLDSFSRALSVREVQNQASRDGAPNDNAAKVARSTGVFANLRGRQELNNQSALALRDLGIAVEKSGQILGEMDKGLTTIVKMYPPYPLDNPERISLLNSFGGLRKQIEDLSFPPPETLDALGRVLKSESSSDYTENDRSDNTFAVQLIKQPMWENLPALDSKSASDEDVKNALEQIRLLASTLNEFSKDSVMDVFKKVNEPEEDLFGRKVIDVREQLAHLETNSGNQGKTGIGGDVLRLEQAVESK